jgi:hypothetical protein
MPLDDSLLSALAGADALTDEHVALALREARRHERGDWVELVARRRPDYFLSGKGFEFLEGAIAANWHEGLSALLRGGGQSLADSLVDVGGMDLLMLATLHHQPDCVRAALQFCDPAATNADGLTALMVSLQCTVGWSERDQHLDCIAALAAVSDLSQMDPEGRNAFSLAFIERSAAGYATILAPFVKDPAAALDELLSWNNFRAGLLHGPVYDWGLIDELGGRLEMTEARASDLEGLVRFRAHKDFAELLPKTFASAEALRLRDAVSAISPTPKRPGAASVAPGLPEQAPEPAPPAAAAPSRRL